MLFLDLDWHSSILKTTVLMHPKQTGLSKTNFLCGIADSTCSANVKKENNELKVTR